MSRLALAAFLLLACIVGPVLSLHVSEFDSTVSELESFTQLLELTESHEADTNTHLDAEASEDDAALLEVSENPSYTLAYPPITYAATAAGGFMHPMSNVNPLSAPWGGFAPVAGVAGFPAGAALAASPLSAYFGGALHPALGMNPALLHAAGGEDVNKGGYNVHGLTAANVFGGYHPGLNNDLTSLSGKAAEEAASFMEASSESELDSAAEMDAEAAIDADVAAFLEGDAESDMTDAEFADIDPMDVLLQVGEDGEEEAGGEEAAAEEGGEEAAAEEGGEEAAGGEAGANPSYTLPYPPVLPGHYSPLFSPYSNVNPLSTPFSNYAAQPGAHPGVAAAAAAQAGALAAVNGQVAGANGGYPYYPYAAAPVGAAPFSGYAGWIHPQNLNSASVGENADAESLGQFIEIATEETEHGECVGCSY